MPREGRNLSARNWVGFGRPRPWRDGGQIRPNSERVPRPWRDGFAYANPSRQGRGTRPPLCERTYGFRLPHGLIRRNPTQFRTRPSPRRGGGQTRPARGGGRVPPPVGGGANPSRQGRGTRPARGGGRVPPGAGDASSVGFLRPSRGKNPSAYP